MQKIKFPQNWLLNTYSLPQISSKLSLPIDYLLRWERKIKFNYHKKRITTKGKPRELLIPVRELRNIQRKILYNILNFEFQNYVHGGVTGRSVITNARTHLNQKWVMCLDVKDFFPSVHFKKIYSNFVLLNCSPEVAKLLMHFTTYEYQLPQGAPTSPAIANMVLYNLDKRIFSLCKIKGLKYSRYFDDITISGTHNPQSILKKCEIITRQEGFKINKKPGKLRILPSSQEQIVTGLLVNNKKLHMPSETIDKIQDILDRLNLGDSSIFLDKDPIKIKTSIKGHLSFLKSVDAQMTKKLEEKFLKINWDSFCC